MKINRCEWPKCRAEAKRKLIWDYCNKHWRVFVGPPVSEKEWKKRVAALGWKSSDDKPA